MDVVRTYAKVAGVVIVLIGVAGLVLGEKSLGASSTSTSPRTSSTFSPAA
ncbi:MAG: hypothetical protein WKF47_13535 [Geodermatophilaceae bacterium]